jgi:hypothetical protein
VVDDIGNAIAPRSDIHKAFDNGKSVNVPKEGNGSFISSGRRIFWAEISIIRSLSCIRGFQSRFSLRGFRRVCFRAHSSS